MTKLRAFAAVLLVAAAALSVAAWRIAALGPPPLGKDLEFSTEVLDRNGRLLRDLCHKRRPLALAGNGCRCRSALLQGVVRL